MELPVHPCTWAAEFGIEFGGIGAIEPRGFLEFLQLETRAWHRRTWAGGREETCIPAALA